MLPWHTTTIFADPDTFGLRLITDVYLPFVTDYCDVGFDVVAIWKTLEGEYLIGKDVGCSCLKPFENTVVGDLTPIWSKGDVIDFLEKVWSVASIEDYFDGLTDGLDLG